MLDLPFYLVANERPLINVDATLFVNLGLWIFLFLILRPLLWSPMIKLITAREASMRGSRDKARDLDADAKKKKTEYEEALKRARQSASKERERLRNDGRKKEAEILAQARQSTQTALDAQRAQIREARGKVEAEMNAMVPQLATDIASKVLGREVRA